MDTMTKGVIFTMYYLHNLLTGDILRFETKAELCRHWTQNNLNFADLNVTGKDERFVFVNPGSSPTGDWYSRKPRRWLVTDDAGRKIDIRTWDSALFTTQTETHNTLDFGFFGAKNHAARAHVRGPKLQRREMMRANDDGGFSELEIEQRAVRGNTMPRRKAVMSAHTFRDNIYHHGKKSCSWKDQTKSPYQHTKHKTGVTRQATIRHCPPEIQNDEYNTETILDGIYEDAWVED